MTVKELITQLQKYPEESLVQLKYYCERDIPHYPVYINITGVHKVRVDRYPTTIILS